MEKIDFNKEIDNNNKLILKIFNLVKLQDWKSIKEFINKRNTNDTIKVYEHFIKKNNTRLPLLKR